jgi:hypothetical protein
LRVPRVVARVLREERPRLVRRVSEERRRARWLAPVLASAALLVTVLVADEAALVCPPGATGEQVSDDYGFEHEFCVDGDGLLHGRYQMLLPSGEVLMLGGFDRSRPSGTWAQPPATGP